MQYALRGTPLGLDLDDGTIRRVIEAMPVGVIVADARGKIVFVNGYGSSLLGYAPDELIGRAVDDLVPSRLRNAHAAQREVFVAEPAERPMGAGLELHALRRDGTEFAVAVGLTPIVSGGAPFTLATIVDMSERRAIEAQRLALHLERQRHHDLEISLHTEHRRVAALQSAFAQRPLPKIHGVAFESVYRPAGNELTLGGDWHDAFHLPGGSLAISIGDVTGHGLDAALEMIHIREALRAGSLSMGSSPGAAMEATNRRVASMTDATATALLAYYDPVTRRMTIACAGHPAPIRVRAGIATTLDVHGIMLGAADDLVFDDVAVDLIDGDVVAFYTDGLIEAQHRPIEGEAMLLDELARYRDDGVDGLVDVLLNRGQSDDATLVLMAVGRHRSRGERRASATLRR